MPDCPFCAPAATSLVAEAELVLTLRDAFPASPGHTLVVPRRHVASFFELTDAEQAAALEAVRVARVALEAKLHPDGFNVGVNVGAAAGQTVTHAHVHLIPRFTGDVPNPRGGIRHAVTGKGYY